MRATQHPSNNDVLGAPPGATIDECHALPITRAQFEDGAPVVISYWRPTDEERTAIANGSDVRLMVAGRTHAPIAMGVAGEDL